MTAVLMAAGSSGSLHAQAQKPGAKSVDELWFEAQEKATTIRDGHRREDVTVYERFLAAHKDYVPAMMAIAHYYFGAAEAITDRSAASVATRTRYLEAAAVQYRRLTEVAESIDAGTAMVGLGRALDASHLNRPAEVAAAARAAIKKYPDNPAVVTELLKVQLPTAEAVLDPARLRAARAAMPPTPQAQYALAFHLRGLERGDETTRLPRETSRRLLAEAVAALDTALKMRPNDYEVMMFKALVLTAQADRVEQDPARIKALRAEADRLRAQATKLMKR